MIVVKNAQTLAQHETRTYAQRNKQKSKRNHINLNMKGVLMMD